MLWSYKKQLTTIPSSLVKVSLIWLLLASNPITTPSLQAANDYTLPSERIIERLQTDLVVAALSCMQEEVRRDKNTEELYQIWIKIQQKALEMNYVPHEYIIENRILCIQSLQKLNYLPKQKEITHSYDLIDVVEKNFTQIRAPLVPIKKVIEEQKKKSHNQLSTRQETVPWTSIFKPIREETPKINLWKVGFDLLSLTYNVGNLIYLRYDLQHKNMKKSGNFLLKNPMDHFRYYQEVLSHDEVFLRNCLALMNAWEPLSKQAKKGRGNDKLKLTKLLEANRKEKYVFFKEAIACVVVVNQLIKKKERLAKGKTKRIKLISQMDSLQTLEDHSHLIISSTDKEKAKSSYVKWQRFKGNKSNDEILEALYEDDIYKLWQKEIDQIGYLTTQKSTEGLIQRLDNLSQDILEMDKLLRELPEDSPHLFLIKKERANTSYIQKEWEDLKREAQATSEQKQYENLIKKLEANGGEKYDLFDESLEHMRELDTIIADDNLIKKNKKHKEGVKRLGKKILDLIKRPHFSRAKILPYLEEEIINCFPQVEDEMYTYLSKTANFAKWNQVIESIIEPKRARARGYKLRMRKKKKEERRDELSKAHVTYQMNRFVSITANDSNNEVILAHNEEDLLMIIEEEQPSGERNCIQSFTPLRKGDLAALRYSPTSQGDIVIYPLGKISNPSYWPKESNQEEAESGVNQSGHVIEDAFTSISNFIFGPPIGKICSYKTNTFDTILKERVEDSLIAKRYTCSAGGGYTYLQPHSHHLFLVKSKQVKKSYNTAPQIFRRVGILNRSLEKPKETNFPDGSYSIALHGNEVLTGHDKGCIRRWEYIRSHGMAMPYEDIYLRHSLYKRGKITEIAWHPTNKDILYLVVTTQKNRGLAMEVHNVVRYNLANKKIETIEEDIIFDDEDSLRLTFNKEREVVYRCGSEKKEYAVRKEPLSNQPISKKLIGWRGGAIIGIAFSSLCGLSYLYKGKRENLPKKEKDGRAKKKKKRKKKRKNLSFGHQ